LLENDFSCRQKVSRQKRVILPANLILATPGMLLGVDRLSQLVTTLLVIYQLLSLSFLKMETTPRGERHLTRGRVGFFGMFFSVSIEVSSECQVEERTRAT